MKALPPPVELGLPSHFRAWRPGQESHVWELLLSAQRFSALVLPTGSGKSLTYAAWATIDAGRTAILTSTKGLQDQLSADYGALLGWAEVRGQSNYPCAADTRRTAGEGVCHTGAECPFRDAGCLYYDALRVASRAKVVVTNYAFWLYANQHGQGIGKFDNLILDEAHSVPEEVSEFLSCYVSQRDLDLFRVGPPPTHGWGEWADFLLRLVRAELDLCRHKENPRPADIRHYRELARQLTTLRSASGDAWVLEALPKGYRWDLVWPGPYAEQLIYRNTPRVLLVSATIRPKTLDLLGVRAEECDWFESDSLFPLRRRPVIWVPTARIDYKSDAETLARWASRIDEAIKPRLDRKGIIHSVSYQRREYLRRASAYSQFFYCHDDAKGIRNTVAEFKAVSAPAILLSPSVTTGFDFPYRTCEYQILPKVPFPSPSTVLRARTKVDPLYLYYVAMVDVVQMVGRGMRASDDQCETLIVDDHWSWFLRRYRAFAPKWFLKACKTSQTVPAPPPRLGPEFDR